MLQNSDISPSCLMHIVTDSKEALEPPKITLFKNEFADVLDDPKELPPLRGGL